MFLAIDLATGIDDGGQQAFPATVGERSEIRPDERAIAPERMAGAAGLLEDLRPARSVSGELQRRAKALDDGRAVLVAIGRKDIFRESGHGLGAVPEETLALGRAQGRPSDPAARDGFQERGRPGGTLEHLVGDDRPHRRQVRRPAGEEGCRCCGGADTPQAAHRADLDGIRESRRDEVTQQTGVLLSRSGNAPEEPQSGDSFRICPQRVGGYLSGRVEQRGGTDQARLQRVPPAGPVVEIGGDDDFRNGKMVRFYSRYLPPDKPVRFVTRQEWTRTGPQWLLLHRQAPDYEPKPRIEAFFGVPYELQREFRYAGVSGFHWFVYRRADPP